MPIYEYEPDSGHCDYCRDRFEVIQAMNDEPLTACPECGQSCHRVLSAFAVSNRPGDILSPKNLEAKGFTQYKKSGDGTYDKTFGKGPSQINRD